MLPDCAPFVFEPLCHRSEVFCFFLHAVFFASPPGRPCLVSFSSPSRCQVPLVSVSLPLSRVPACLPRALSRGPTPAALFSSLVSALPLLQALAVRFPWFLCNHTPAGSAVSSLSSCFLSLCRPNSKSASKPPDSRSATLDLFLLHARFFFFLLFFSFPRFSTARAVDAGRSHACATAPAPSTRGSFLRAAPRPSSPSLEPRIAFPRPPSLSPPLPRFNFAMSTLQTSQSPLAAPFFVPPHRTRTPCLAIDLLPFALLLVESAAPTAPPLLSLSPLRSRTLSLSLRSRSPTRSNPHPRPPRPPAPRRLLNPVNVKQELAGQGGRAERGDGRWRRWRTNPRPRPRPRTRTRAGVTSLLSVPRGPVICWFPSRH